MTRMSNENLMSSPGITSSYLYKVFYQVVIIPASKILAK